MKVAPVLAAALVIYIAIPGSNQGKNKKPKPKFCKGKDGNNYKKGESYEDQEACIRYTCIKKGKNFKMQEEEIKCTECKQDLIANVTALEAGVKFLNRSIESMESKMESILGIITAMQSTTSNLEVNITSIMDAISNNKEAISSNKDTCLAIETTTAKLETCLGDVNSTDCPSSGEGKISVIDAIKENKEDIAIKCTEALAKPRFNLALTAGYNNRARFLATSEILSPGGVCSQSIPPLPLAVRFPQSVYFNNMLMVCGGGRGGSDYTYKQCYQLLGSNSEWTEGPTMNTPRTVFSMTKAGQDLYALGGYYDGRLDSMEKLSESSGEWTIMEQKLTSPRNAHCTVFMEKTRSLVIIGGNSFVEGISSNLVEEFHIATLSWKELSALPVELYGHGCAQLDQTIVVTGGLISGAVQQKKVYTFAGGQWATTGELKKARAYHFMGTLDNKLLVLGGSSGFGTYFDTIEEMKKDGSFQIMEWKLNEKRGYSSALSQVPRQMFPCL